VASGAANQAPARLGIAADFLSEYGKLGKPIRRAVDATIAKFGQHTHAGLHLEKLNNAKDPRIRTIRVTEFWRGVVLAPGLGQEYLLLRVMPHDDAIAYATSRRFTVNQALGVLEVRDEKALETITPEFTEAAAGTERTLFAEVSDKDLVHLGVDAQLLPLVRALSEEAQLEALATLLPAIQYDALVALAAGMTVEQAWTEISQHVPTHASAEPVDTDDVVAAAARTPDRYTFVSGPAELAQILAHPFDAWRIFLHPRQREIAYRPTYAGPALITGGAGTGKTVTALHRAAFLARADTGRVLLTTYNRGLAEALQRQLAALTDPEVLERVEVINVDRLANHIVAEARGAPTVADSATLNGLWRAAATAAGRDFSVVFLQREGTGDPRPRPPRSGRIPRGPAPRSGQGAAASTEDSRVERDPAGRQRTALGEQADLPADRRGSGRASGRAHHQAVRPCGCRRGARPEPGAVAAPTRGGGTRAGRPVHRRRSAPADL
jgi:hypothetical protein